MSGERQHTGERGEKEHAYAPTREERRVDKDGL
jgi:hypothetical protein